ncbi:MAG: tetratricopeptide repeat protein [Acidobacteriota bacterium]
MLSESIAGQQQNEISEPRAWRWLKNCADRYIILALVMVAFAAFANSLNDRFVYEEHLVIETNYGLRDWNYFKTAFVGSHSSDWSWLNLQTLPVDYYRPFIRIYFSLAFQAFGLNAQYWHLAYVVMFCLIVVLVYLIIKRISNHQAVAAIAALLFAVHPIHSEAVAWLNGGEVLQAVFLLGGFALYFQARVEDQIRKRRIFFLGSLVLVAAAMLSKETALCFPILVAAYHFINSQEGFWRRTWLATCAAIPFLLVVVGYFVLRYFAYGGSLRVTGGMPLKTTLLTIPQVALQYFRLLILPLDLNIVYNVPLVESASNANFWAPLLLFIGVAVLVCLYMPPTLRYVFIWMAVTLLPALNIGLFIPELMIQDRYAFLPSLGFCAALAMGLSVLLERINRPTLLKPGLLIATLLVVAILLGLTIRQNSFWQSDETIFARAAAINPNSAFVQCNYGWSLYYEGKLEEAAQYFTRHFQQSNGKSGCSCLGLGKYYYDRKDYNQAIQFYQRAIELGEGDVNMQIFTNLAQAYIDNGQREQAIALLNRTLASYPQFEQARVLLSQLHNSRLSH